MADYLLRKQSRYFFRRRLPASLAQRLATSEIVRILPPCTAAAARSLARQMASATDLIFGDAMARQNITPDEFDDLVREYFAKFLGKFDAGRAGYSRDGLEALEKTYSQGRDALKHDTWQSAAKATREILTKAGFKIDEDSDQFRDLCRKLTRALTEATRIEIARLQGDYTEGPKDPLFRGAGEGASAKLPKVRLSEAYERFKADKIARKEWRAGTVTENDTSYELFAEFFGDPYLQNIKRADVAEFRAVLQALPRLRGKSAALSDKPLKELVALTQGDGAVAALSPRTVNKHMSKLSSLLAWAQMQGYVASNEAKGVHKSTNRKRDARKDRAAWAPDQLKKLFSSPFYQGCKSATRRAERGQLIIKDHFYWLPLIGAFHPVRAEEIAQLYVNDVREEGGILYFDIDGGLDADEVQEKGKQIKSPAARRRVPVHALLLEVGFGEYVRRQARRGGERLFPELEAKGRSARFSQYFCRRFGEHIRDFGIRGVNFHGFRHTTITALSEANSNPDVRDQLAGHKAEGERWRYNKGASLPTLKAAIDSIAYPGITADMFPSAKVP